MKNLRKITDKYINRSAWIAIQMEMYGKLKAVWFGSLRENKVVTCGQQLMLPAT